MSDETSSRGPDVVQKNNDAMLEADSVTMVTESAVVESIQGKRRLDVAEWLKNLRLNKYTPELTKYSWEQLCCLTYAELVEEGITIGRKLLREAENLNHLMSDETSSRGPDVVQKNNDAMLEADSVTMVTESAVVESIQGKRRLVVAEWLKNLRLHKYTPEVTKYSWEQLCCLTDAELEEEGLTIGRKLLREAENLK